MDTREGTEMIEKGELIVGEINMGRGPINLVPVDVKTVRIRESPVDVGIVPILESHVDTGTTHVHAVMSIGVQTP